jgi:hypothetical protein
VPGAVHGIFKPPAEARPVTAGAGAGATARGSTTRGGSGGEHH